MHREETSCPKDHRSINRTVWFANDTIDVSSMSSKLTYYNSRFPDGTVTVGQKMRSHIFADQFNATCLLVHFTFDLSHVCTDDGLSRRSILNYDARVSRYDVSCARNRLENVNPRVRCPFTIGKAVDQKKPTQRNIVDRAER